MSLPQVKQGLKFNGLTDYLQLPSMTMDVIEIDCLLDVDQKNSAKIVDARTGLANGYAMISSSSLNLGLGWSTSSGFALGGRTTIKFNASGIFTDNVVIGANYTLDNDYLKSFIYSITCYLNGNIVAQYHLNEGTGTVATDTSGNGNNGTINGATWIIKKAPIKGKKNLIDALELGDIVAGNNSASSVVTRTTNYIPVLPNTTYTLSRKDPVDLGIAKRWRTVWGYDSSKASASVVIDTNAAGDSVTFTTGATQYYVRVGFNLPYSELGVAQIELGSVATSYEPYIPVPNSKPIPQKPKKNLLPPFSQWTLHANAVVNSDYSLTLNATAAQQVSYYDVPVVLNKTYTFNVTTTSARIDINEISSGGSNVNPHGTVTLPFTVTVTDPNVAFIRVLMSNAAVGQFTFDKPQLELGSVVTSFEEYKLISDVKLVPLVPKKNMIPPFSQWTLNANAVVTEPYKLTLNSTGTFQSTSIDFVILPNTTYTASISTGGIGGYSEFGTLDASNTFTSITNTVGSSGDLTRTFTTPANAVKLRCITSNTATGTFIFANPQLEKGAVATPFENYQLVPDVKPIV